MMEKMIDPSAKAMPKVVSFQDPLPSLSATARRLTHLLRRSRPGSDQICSRAPTAGSIPASGKLNRKMARGIH
jgi:hypothetical protein